MKESLRMLTSLTVICAVCAFALSGFRAVTGERIEEQELKYVQGPAVIRLLQGAANDPIADRIKLMVDGKETLCFLAEDKEEYITAIAYETSADGFAGAVRVMVAWGVEDKRLLGIGIVAHQETAGVGSRITTGDFTTKFGNGQTLQSRFQLKRDGGDIDGISGATYSSRAVAAALKQSAEQYENVMMALEKYLAGKGKNK